jgi:hypothetical protein
VLFLLLADVAGWQFVVGDAHLPVAPQKTSTNQIETSIAEPLSSRDTLQEG